MINKDLEIENIRLKELNKRYMKDLINLLENQKLDLLDKSAEIFKRLDDIKYARYTSELISQANDCFNLIKDISAKISRLKLEGE